MKDISFSMDEGEALVILGQSGIGKSTILKLMAGLLEPESGALDIDPGESVVGTRLVFQSPRLFPWLSVRGNLHFALRSAGVPKAQWSERIEPLMEQVGLGAEIDHATAELSIGMAQRVALVRSLVCQPGVLLLDEPFSALDPKRRKQLQQDLLKLVGYTGVSVVMVTHDVDEALEIGDQVVVLNAQPAELACVVRPADLGVDEARAQIERHLLS